MSQILMSVKRNGANVSVFEGAYNSAVLLVAWMSEIKFLVLLSVVLLGVLFN